MIGHHFDFNNRIAVQVLFFEDHFFDPCIDWGDKHFAPVFWAENNMAFAADYEPTRTMQFIQGHAAILYQNKRSVYSARGEAPGRQALAPYIPPLEAGGFYGAFHNVLGSCAGSQCSFENDIMILWELMKTTSKLTEPE